MSAETISVFIMMSVAASLGFSIAWVYRNRKSINILDDYGQQKLLVSQLKEEQESLIKHSNNLQANTLRISEKNEKQAKRIQSMKEMVKQLEADKNFLLSEYKQFQTEAEEKLGQRAQLVQALEELRDKNQKNKLKADKWKIKVHDLQEQLKQTASAYQKLKKEHDQFVKRFADSDEHPRLNLEWEEKYKKLKLRFLALTKEKQDIETEMHTLQEEENLPLDETLNKLSQEIVLLKKENSALKQNAPSPENKKQIIDPKEELFQRIKNRQAQVNWKRIGKATKDYADNLKILKGLGPLMEEKLHAIGIFTFDQLAQMSDYDQNLFNHFLELPKGKFQHEKWVSQAQELVSQEILSGDTAQRIQKNLEQLNLGDKGEASPSQKDNLQAIIGIGPYIEQKLNAIGIFRVEQLARLSSEDIAEINSIMKLAPGHIHKDDWVGQAKRMK